MNEQLDKIMRCLLEPFKDCPVLSKVAGNEKCAVPVFFFSGVTLNYFVDD